MEELLTYSSVAIKALKRMSEFNDIKIDVRFNNSTILFQGYDEKKNHYSLYLNFENNHDFSDITEEFIMFLENEKDVFNFESILICNTHARLFEYFCYDRNCTEFCKCFIKILRDKFEKEREQKRIEEERKKKEKMLADHNHLKEIVKILEF
jgi:hypothetical protein